jgi:hypothetical protein
MALFAAGNKRQPHIEGQTWTRDPRCLGGREGGSRPIVEGRVCGAVVYLRRSDAEIGRPGETQSLSGEWEYVGFFIPLIARPPNLP